MSCNVDGNGAISVVDESLRVEEWVILIWPFNCESDFF